MNPGENCPGCSHKAEPISGGGHRLVAFKPRGPHGPTVYRDMTGIAPEHFGPLNSARDVDWSERSESVPINPESSSHTCDFIAPRLADEGGFDKLNPQAGNPLHPLSMASPQIYSNPSIQDVAPAFDETVHSGAARLVLYPAIETEATFLEGMPLPEPRKSGAPWRREIARSATEPKRLHRTNWPPRGSVRCGGRVGTYGITLNKTHNVRITRRCSYPNTNYDALPRALKDAYADALALDCARYILLDFLSEFIANSQKEQFPSQMHSLESSLKADIGTILANHFDNPCVDPCEPEVKLESYALTNMKFAPGGPRIHWENVVWDSATNSTIVETTVTIPIDCAFRLTFSVRCVDRESF